ncbi:hypothetical protein [Ensifer aridi]|nr:hypothetical protein [Ensifer aridi]
MFLLAKDTVKFAVLVGLSAIFIDAVIAHGSSGTMIPTGPTG